MQKNNLQAMLPFRYRQELSNTEILNNNMKSIVSALKSIKDFMDEYANNMLDK